MHTDPGTQASFYGLGIAPGLLDLLDRHKFVTPTPIQLKSIPHAVQGKDVIGIAQTGTGKTLAFGIPMLQRLQQQGGRGLVILPTRELAYQVEETLLKFGPTMGIGTAVFVGGASMHLQRQMLKRNPRILVATPGRLIDHLQQKTITLREVSILVLDEADRMLDMGFAPQINRILEHVPKERQTLLFSATMPDDIVRIATHHMKLPLRVEVAPAGTTAERVDQELFVVEKQEKFHLLLSVLQQYTGTILVFSRTKHGAKKMTRAIRENGHEAAEIHANRSLAQRREALEGFKNGKYRILVATDIAARGIDVTGIELVVNYDLPSTPEDYVHRIGRTGRAGKTGKAISFATPDQHGDIRAIERLIRSPLKRGQHARSASAPAAHPAQGTSPAAAPNVRHAPSRGGHARPPRHRGQQRGHRGRRRGGSDFGLS